MKQALQRIFPSPTVSSYPIHITSIYDAALKQSWFENN